MADAYNRQYNIDLVEAHNCNDYEKRFKKHTILGQSHMNLKVVHDLASAVHE